MKKDVKPISARQMGELARLLEERGVDADVVQQQMINNIKGLCFFLNRGFNFVGKEVKIAENGWLLIMSNSKIDATVFDVHNFMVGRGIVRVGDEIVSNGRYGPPKGTKGTVIEILEPYSLGNTTDVIEVDFHDSGGTYPMKPKDIEV